MAFLIRIKTMTATQKHDDATTEALFDMAVELAKHTPDLLAAGMSEIDQQLILIAEYANHTQNEALARAVDQIWEALQGIQTTAINQMIATTTAGIVVTALRIQRDEAMITAAQAIARVKQLSGLTGE